jgi:hypothetical protein
LTGSRIDYFAGDEGKMSIQWRKTRTRAWAAVACTFCALAVPGSPLPASAAEPCAHDQICGLKKVNDWSDGTLRVLSLRDGVKPATIRVGDFHPDNVHVLPDGNLLIAGQIGTARDIMACVKAPACSVGSMIVVVDPRTREVRSHWTVAPTSTFGAASTALLHGQDYWVSSFRGDRIVRLGPAPGE